MAQINANRVREQTTFAGGTGAVTLTTAPVSGFQSFLTGWGASGSGWVCLVIGAQWEICEASINAGGTTLTRGTLDSSSTGSQINFSAGTMDCFAVIPGSKLGLNADGTAAAPSISFYNDRDSGFYRIGANNVGLALAGTKVVDFLTTKVAIIPATASTSTTTGALTVAGGLGVEGAAFVGGPLSFPTSMLTAANVDTSGALLSFTAGEIKSFPASASGMVILTSNTTGSTALFLIGGGYVVLVAQSIVGYVASSTPSAAEIGVYFSSGYKIKNGYASTQTMHGYFVRTRPAP